MPGQELNLLSLDGGGVRGLSSLYILQRLMEAVNPEKPPKPCDYFDMIAGTSTGGLIAIMLGRLKMDVQQCIDAYRELSNQAFKRRRRIPFSMGGKVCERFDSKELEMAIKKILVTQGYSEDTLLKEPGASCRVFVCATSDGTSTIVPLQSYRNERSSFELYNTTRIWEAGRATSAASTFFDSITIGPSKQRFFDGATGANNPVRQLWKEAKDVWSSAPLESNIGCIVSIGTGVPSIKKFGKDGLEIFQTLKRIATETEATARDFHQEHTDLDESNRYFRFNVPDGLAEVGLDEVSESSTIVDGTQYYLANELVHKQVKTCAKALGEREVCKVITLVETPNPDDPSLFLALSKRPEWDLALQEGVPSFNIFDRVSDYEPDRTHRSYLRNRCEGTTSWILHHELLLAWFEKESHSCLWLSGKIGCGKTLITSTVVQHLIQESLKAGDLVAHFFFSHSNKTRLEATHLFQSYIKQILGYLHITRNPCPSRIVSYVKRFYGYKRYPPSFDEVIDEIFLPLSVLLPSTTYVVDGIDECEPEQVREILKTFQKIGLRRGPRIFISGREALDVASSIPGSNTICISEEYHKEDIRKFINWKIEEKMRERKLTEDERVLQDIKSKLNERADRMILWVSLQLDALWDDCFTDADIRKALANLPKDLGETYARCLTKKSVQQSRFAPKILRWVCAATKPFKIDQLREALAVDPNTGCLCRDELPLTQEVLKCCSNLITQDKDGRVLLAHHSVRQFLENQPADAQLLPNGFKLNTAKLELGQLCVTHLTSSDYSLALQPSNANRGPTIQLSSAAVETVIGPGQSWMRPFFPRARPVQMLLPSKTSTFSHVKEPPSFFSFAKEQWALLTRSIDKRSDCWPRFRTLALEPNFSWRWHPWEPIGQSPQSHYCGLLGWATANQHLPLLQALLTSQEVKANAEIFNLPLYHYGNLPVLHLASRTANARIFNLILPLCNPKKTDHGLRTPLHHAAETGCIDIALQLIKRKVSKDAKDENGDTALEIAARNGLQDMVRYLVELGVHTNAKRKGMIMSKVLSLAAMNGHDSTVKVLAELGAEIRVRDDNGWSALHWAASNGHRNTVRALIELGADVKAESSDGWTALQLGVSWVLAELGAHKGAKDGNERTALHWAISNRHYDTTIFLVELGADVKAEDSNGQTALHWAASTGHHDIIRFLVKIGANVEAKDSSGQTALHWAASKGHHDITKVLVKLGADVEAKDCDRQTALHWAASNGHRNTVRALIELGADIKAESRSGWTALQLGVTRVLAELGAHKGAKDSNERTALYWALSNRHYGTIILLVELGADVEAKDSNGQTALHWAVSNGHHDIMGFLVKLGADVEAKDGNGQTALRWAASNGHHNTVRVLVELGAEVGAGDDDRWTALHWAASIGHETTVRALIKLGADVNKEADFKADDDKREMPLRLKIPNKFLTREGDTKLRCTSLWLASRNNHPEVFQHLAEVGANRNAITLEGHSREICAVAFSPDGRLIVSSSVDGTVELWDTTTGLQTTLKGHSSTVNTVAFSPDGKLVASASYDRTVVLWDTATETVQATLEGHSGTVWSVTFSPDGKLVASASTDSTVVLWDTATATMQATLKGHSGTVWGVAFSPDGKLVASASTNRTVVLWDTATATVQATLRGHSGRVWSVAFSPDGKLVASASHDRTVVLWDTATATVQATLRGHSGEVLGVAFSPDGKLVASASDDETVVLWDTATATVQATLKGHFSFVLSVAFSPDGKLVASASNDGTVKLWLVGPRG